MAVATDRRDLLKAIKATANGNTALSTAVDSDVCYDHVPDGTTMPYITYHFVTDDPINTFADQFEDVTVQFSLFDKRSSVAYIEAISSDLDLVFGRKTLTYDSASAIGCIRAGQTNAQWFAEDRCWMKTIDYSITFK